MKPALCIASLGLLAACGSASSFDPAPPAPTSGAPPSCDASRVVDLEVSGADRDGFPPYAVAACTLAYVNRAGDLVVRDLSGTSPEATLATASEHPRRPAVSESTIAWEADEGGHSVVRARANAITRTVTGPFAAAGEPRVSGTSVVFTAWAEAGAGADTDVWLFDAGSGEAHLALGGAGQQRFADVSSRYIVATDFSEDPDGRFDGNETDLADLVVLDRVSGGVSTRRLPGKQSFPILGEGDAIAYLDWGSIHPEPKLQAYAVRSGLLVGPPKDRTVATVAQVSATYARPALAGATLEWVANPDGMTRLYRAPLDGSAPPAVVSGLDSLRLYAPASTRAFTILATAPNTSAGTLPRLRAVTR